MTTERLSTKQLTSLDLTLDILLNKQEKTWGCFQVIKEGDFYTLQVPTLSNLKLFANPKSIGYKGYWRNMFDDRLPDVKDRKEKPDIYTRKKTKQVEVRVGDRQSRYNDSATDISPANSSEEIEIEATDIGQNNDSFEVRYKRKPLKLDAPKRSKKIKLKHGNEGDKDANDIPESLETEKSTKATKQIDLSGEAKIRTILKKQTVFEVVYRYNNCPEINLLNKLITKAIGDRIQSNATFDSMTEIMPLVLIKSADD